MGGIMSLLYKTENPDMGKEAEALLCRIAYRDCDSIGASFIDDKRRIVLLKNTGAPLSACGDLGISGKPGQRFIGQAGGAGCGAIADSSSQPYRVDCKIELVGAHVGTISNTDTMKTWLSFRGHAVISDSEGEIIVHLVEEHYATNQTLTSADLAGMRQAYAASGLRDGLPDGVLRMIDAIRKANALAEGSYAAIIADPKLPGVFAVKSGSALYGGIGSDDYGDFLIVSSDLPAVLSKTTSLIPFSDGEGIWSIENGCILFNLRGSLRFSRPKP